MSVDQGLDATERQYRQQHGKAPEWFRLGHNPMDEFRRAHPGKQTYNGIPVELDFDNDNAIHAGPP